MTTASLTENGEQKRWYTPLNSLWARLPVLVRSVVGGSVVFLLITSVPSSLMMLNMQISPAIPWFFPVGLAYLWVVFQFFNGRWGTSTSVEARRQSMRARRLSKKEWIAAGYAAFLVMIFFIAETMISYRLVEVPGEEMLMPDMPWWSVYSALLMISIVAGVSEEVGFRGYMQRPLEKRFGPVFAITVASVMFWIAHLNHANGVPRIGALIVMGASLGVLAWCSRSIYPAIIAHATADTLIFVGSVAEIGPSYIWHPVPLKESGIDAFFWVVLSVMVVSGVLGAVALKRLSVICREKPAA